MQDTKHCPYCGEEIKMSAKKCRYCGEWLNEEDQNAISSPKKTNCPICGEETNEDITICPHCGEKVNGYVQNKSETNTGYSPLRVNSNNGNISVQKAQYNNEAMRISDTPTKITIDHLESPFSDFAIPLAILGIIASVIIGIKDIDVSYDIFGELHSALLLIANIIDSATSIILLYSIYIGLKGIGINKKYMLIMIISYALTCIALCFYEYGYSPLEVGFLLDTESDEATSLILFMFFMLITAICTLVCTIIACIDWMKKYGGNLRKVSIGIIVFLAIEVLSLILSETIYNEDGRTDVFICFILYPLSELFFFIFAAKLLKKRPLKI